MLPFPSSMMQGSPGAKCAWNESNYQGDSSVGFESPVRFFAADPGACIATVGKSAGKFYCEVLIRALTAPPLTAGIGLSPQINTAFPYRFGGAGYGCSFANDGSLTCTDTFGHVASYGPTYGQGDTVMIAADVSNALIWFGVNGVFVGNPVAGSGGKVLLHTLYYPAIALQTASGGGSVDTTAAFSTGDFAYTPPVGFAQWR